jgi:hypothetical protein
MIAARDEYPEKIERIDIMTLFIQTIMISRVLKNDTREKLRTTYSHKIQSLLGIFPALLNSRVPP